MLLKQKTDGIASGIHFQNLTLPYKKQYKSSIYLYSSYEVL